MFGERQRARVAWPAAAGMRRPGVALRRSTLGDTKRCVDRIRTPVRAGGRRCPARHRAGPIAAGRGRARSGVARSARRGGRGCRASSGASVMKAMMRISPPQWGAHERENFVDAGEQPRPGVAGGTTVEQTLGIGSRSRSRANGGRRDGGLASSLERHCRGSDGGMSGMPLRVHGCLLSTQTSRSIFSEADVQRISLMARTAPSSAKAGEQLGTRSITESPRPRAAATIAGW